MLRRKLTICEVFCGKTIDFLKYENIKMFFSFNLRKFLAFALIKFNSLLKLHSLMAISGRSGPQILFKGLSVENSQQQFPGENCWKMTAQIASS